MSAEIHVNDIGTILKVIVKVAGIILDISAATNKRIILTGPHDRDFNKEAIFDTDGSDGVLKYVSMSGDFYEAGTWKIQAFVKLPTGSWHTDIAEFPIAENL